MPASESGYGVIMNKKKTDIEKWHKEYRKKFPEWKERKEARRRKELGIKDEEIKSSIPEKGKCFYCDKQGNFYWSPWGVPGSLYLCKFHLWALPFYPKIYINLTIVIFYLIIIGIITAIIKFLF